MLPCSKTRRDACARFVGDALDELRRIGVRDIWSTDSVTHASNVIALAPLIASALA